MDAQTGSTEVGNRILKVDHAGEHGAICVYRSQRWIARWRAPELVPELDEFLAHEQHHRDLFANEMQRRGVPRCRSFHLCGIGGLTLGTITGLMGRKAIASTTVAIESVVLRHLEQQIGVLQTSDPEAAATIGKIIADEQHHHDSSLSHLNERGPLTRLIESVVSISTEAVIWLGMKL
jgi:ubiquinone biosynthesis monooxygenase Coq7